MHGGLLLSILRAPINTYFDVTPVGRILNRFSKDLDNMDSLLPDFFQQILANGFIVIVCISSTFYFLLLLLPLSILFFKTQSYFRHSSRELKRLDGVSRSPLYSFFGEVLQGLTTIRSFNKGHEFTQHFFGLADAQAKNFFVFFFANRWLAFRLDLISNGVLFSVAVLTAGIASTGGLVDPNLLGLALVYALQLTGLLQWTVRMATETENNMTSVERLLAFSNIASEETYVSDNEWVVRNNTLAGAPVPTAQTTTATTTTTTASSSMPLSASSVWPAQGNISIRHLSMRYRPELDLVINDLNLFIPGGTKVGVCGR